MAWGRGKAGNGSSGGSAGGGSSSSSDSNIGGGDDDPTSWILNNEFSNFVLMNTNEIKYMCMFGYAFMHGCKVFKKVGNDAPTSYKFINMILACTGGGILVPIFLNTIPVPLAIDAYPIAVTTAFIVHSYFPVLREVVELSVIFKSVMIVFYETVRTYVVTLFVGLAASTIPSSQFSFPVFGPIVCGTIGGCGGAFLPFNKGLDPIKKDGLAPPMFSAFVAATFYHFFTHYAATIEDGGAQGIPIVGGIVNQIVNQLKVDAIKKGKVFVALWFILYALHKNNIFVFAVASAPAPSSSKSSASPTIASSVKDEKFKSSIPAMTDEKKTD